MTAQSRSKPSLIAGWVLTALAALFLTFDGVVHVMVIPPVVQAFADLGYPVKFAVTLGILELVLVALCLVPRTATIGVVLATAYLGGAIATNLRAEQPVFNLLFPVFVALFLWGGLWLRESGVRAVMPFNRGPHPTST
jgi:hypothetical protein